MMATLEQLSTALVNADKVGDTAAAQQLAVEITRMRGAPQVASPTADEPGTMTSLAAGAGKGFGQVVLNAQRYAGKGLSVVGAEQVGNWLQSDAAAGLKKIEGEVQPYKDAHPIATGAGEITGNVVATLPVGGALGAGAKAMGLNRLSAALATSGMTTGTPVAAGFAPQATNMLLRMAGGAGTGYVSAGLVDPAAANTGAVVGAALPVVGKAVGAVGDVAGSLVRPFTTSGQERIAGDALRQFSTNPNAVENLRRAAPVVEGSMPTAVMAAGDEGLAGLNRTLQSADPRYAAELSTRAASQNAARTAALENVAGNTGKLTMAKEARDAATGPMREAVLNAAGSLLARPVLDSIDSLLAKPDNAGKIAQQALAEVRKRIAQFAPDGQIDARALYAIRKDINDTLSGKLQGEAGNLKLASGQLVQVKGLIDDAIDQASRLAPQSAGRAVMPAGANIERAGMAGAFGSQAPRPSWRQYLETYTQHSIPINQMEKLDEVMRAVSAGTVDQSGNAVLSAAKLNNVLRNQAQDLQKVLAPEQLDLLRRLAADLNASQLASNAGRAVGSNTVQNLAQNNLLSSVLGQGLATSTPSQSVLARVLQLPYGASNRMIQEKLGNALLDPKEAARLMATPETNRLLQSLSGGTAQIGYRAAPAISARP